MSNKQVAIVLAVVAAIIGILYVMGPRKQARKQVDLLAIISFEECVAAGYGALESYPRQCRTPDGRTFIEEVNQGFEDPRDSVPKCGMQECHGLDMTCGSNIPEGCPFIYQIGDRCRKFANCESQETGCKLVTHPKFAVCKACVEKCIADFPNDPVGATNCESSCADIDGT